MGQYHLTKKHQSWDSKLHVLDFKAPAALPMLFPLLFPVWPYRFSINLSYWICELCTSTLVWFNTWGYLLSPGGRQMQWWCLPCSCHHTQTSHSTATQWIDVFGLRPPVSSASYTPSSTQEDFLPSPTGELLYQSPVPSQICSTTVHEGRPSAG